MDANTDSMSANACRRLHRQVGWLRALEDAIDVGSRAPVVEQISPPAATKARTK